MLQAIVRRIRVAITDRRGKKAGRCKATKGDDKNEKSVNCEKLESAYLERESLAEAAAKSNKAIEK